MSRNRGPESSARVRALQLLASEGRPLSIHEVADKLDKSYHTIRSVMVRARAAGWVKRLGRSSHTITSAGLTWLAEREVYMRDIHPDWILRAKFRDSPYPGSAAKVHLFNGAVGACGRRPETSAWKNAALLFCPPDTPHTCGACTVSQSLSAPGVPPDQYAQATGRMVTCALENRDPHQLLVALKMLSAPLVLEPMARVIAEVDPD